MSSTNTDNYTHTKPVNRSITTRLVNRTTLLKRGVWSAITDLASSHVYSHASAIAFNALLSFFPFIILLLVLCRKVLQWPAGYDLILALLRDEYLPVGGQFITHSLRTVVVNNTAATFSLATLAFTSSGVFAPIELALNHAWGVHKERKFWQSKLLALALVIACGSLAMASIVVTVFSRNFLHDLISADINNYFFRLLIAAVSKMLMLPVTISIFFLIYYLLPNRSVPLSRVLPAAIFIGVLWELLKYIFIWCLPLLDFASVYGAFYITITLIMWAFVSSLTLLLGANLSARWPD